MSKSIKILSVQMQPIQKHLIALTVRQFPDKNDNNVCVHNAY